MLIAYYTVAHWMASPYSITLVLGWTVFSLLSSFLQFWPGTPEGGAGLRRFYPQESCCLPPQPLFCCLTSSVFPMPRSCCFWDFCCLAGGSSETSVPELANNPSDPKKGRCSGPFCIFFYGDDAFSKLPDPGGFFRFTSSGRFPWRFLPSGSNVRVQTGRWKCP